MPQLVAALPYIVAIGAVAGTAVSTTAAIQQGEAQKKAADYQAKIQDQQALEARQAAAMKIAEQDQRAARILSSIRASAAASGLDISGSPLIDYTTSSEAAQLNDMYTKYSGNLVAAGSTAQANISRFGGRNAEEAGYLTGTGEIISGFGNLAKFGLTPKSQGGLGLGN